MDNNALVISSKKFRGGTSVISIRLPNELINYLDRIAKDTGRTRNDIIQKFIEFAADNVEIEK